MRLLLEILIIGALVYLGWETPFRDRFPASISGVAESKSNATGTSQPINASAAPHQPFARSTPTPWRLDVGSKPSFGFGPPDAETDSPVMQIYS